MAIIWPYSLPPATIAADPVPRNLSPSIAQSGRRQVVSSGAPAWRVSYGKIPVVSVDRVNTWRAIASLVEGSLTPIILPLYRIQQPHGDTGFGEAPHSDNAPFSDGSPYTGGFVDCHLAGNIAVGAVSCTVTYAYGDRLQPGQTFSIDDRAYRVRTVVDSGANQAITFTPPARQLHLAGSRVEIDRPTLRVRLADDAAMLIELENGRYSFPSLDFVEDL
jgi:hypothetical protein